MDYEAQRVQERMNKMAWRVANWRFSGEHMILFSRFLFSNEERIVQRGDFEPEVIHKNWPRCFKLVVTFTGGVRRISGKDNNGMIKIVNMKCTISCTICTSRVVTVVVFIYLFILI